ncbi:MAG: helix-turn-helix transcriptional regulator [Deltaproteobacteria bacterium]|nr:helix-turn-helix transcriptional regulator [Deltaproteobacteria bacterium]
MSKKLSNDVRCFIIGSSIKKLREHKKITQESLAELADIHTSYVGQIERGLRYPSLKVLFKISDALNVKPADLLKGINSNKNG